MNIRSVPRQSNRSQPNPHLAKNSQSGFIRIAFLMSVCGLIVWGAASLFNWLPQVQADSSTHELMSAVGQYCLDDYNGVLKPGAAIYATACNGSKTQDWTVVNNLIKLNDQYCLGVTGDRPMLEKCANLTSQQWLRDGVGYQNNLTDKCLALSNSHVAGPVITNSCNKLSTVNDSWTAYRWGGKPLSAITSPMCNQSTVGLRVSCYTQRQWLAWQTEPNIHQILLSDYTDGNPYEEWCADFVSYVYKEAGAPFTAGERGNGWDEYNANNIQFMGYTYHAANSSYVPQPGDVAYFNYSGGHVEIVVAGGQHPTFIYGDSGTQDPLTGNGDMAENQITNDGSLGQLVYYLSPK